MKGNHVQIGNVLSQGKMSVSGTLAGQLIGVLEEAVAQGEPSGLGEKGERGEVTAWLLTRQVDDLLSRTPERVQGWTELKEKVEGLIEQGLGEMSAAELGTHVIRDGQVTLVRQAREDETQMRLPEAWPGAMKRAWWERRWGKLPETETQPLTVAG